MIIDDINQANEIINELARMLSSFTQEIEFYENQYPNLTSECGFEVDESEVDIDIRSWVETAIDTIEENKAKQIK